MPRTLTARTIETLKPGPKRKEIPDGYLPNLYLILQPSGVRSWAVRYRIGRRPRKYTFGSYPAFDLKAARELGAKALRAVAEGRDPAREKALARSAAPDTVGSIAEQFVALHCKRLNRPRTIDATQRVLDLHVLPVWKNRLIKEISRRDVIELLDGVIASGRPVAANRTLTALTTMFRWATDRDILVTSPCTGVRPPTPEVSRDRVLTDVELNNVWRAAGKLTPAYRDLVRLLILTGQRRDEVARMTWAELDLDGRLWKLPKERTKNGRPHEVPLSEPVLAILTALPRLGDFVLTATGAAAVTNYSKGKKKLDALLPPDMPHWVLHDLRRSMASGAAELGVQPHIIEAVLNHASGHKGGTAGIYNRANYVSEKKAALDDWARHVRAVTGA